MYNLKFLHNFPNRFFLDIHSFLFLFLFSNRVWKLIVYKHLIFLNLDISFNRVIYYGVFYVHRITFNIILSNIRNTIVRKCTNINCSCLDYLPQLIFNFVQLSFKIQAHLETSSPDCLLYDVIANSIYLIVALLIDQIC